MFEDRINTARNMVESFNAADWDAYTAAHTRDTVYDEVGTSRRTEGIGEIVAHAVQAYFADRTHKDLVSGLIDRGVNTKSLAEAPATRAGVAGLTFVITGTLEKYKRQEAAALLKSLGGKVSSTVSKSTDYVVVGANPGSKADKAKKLGIPMLSESEMEQLVK